jgi:hypothetical protein
MGTAYILYMLLIGQSGVPYLSSQEYTSKETCVAALRVIKDNSRIPLGGSRSDPKTMFCQKK